MSGRRIFEAVLPPLIPFVLITTGIELLVRGGFVRAYLLPAPSAVFLAIWQYREELFEAMLKTSASALIGFALSTLLGIAVAVALSSSRWVQQAFYPYAVFFQTVPIIAIAPLLVIWFGYGMQATVIASAFVVSIFPVIANTLTGILSTDPALRDLFRLYGASPAVTLFKLRFPAALPQILHRPAGGVGSRGDRRDCRRIHRRRRAWVRGGYRAERSSGSTRVFAAVLLASVLGLALFGLINLISMLTLRRWHASEQV